MILRNFISLRAFTVYMENSLRFEICTEVSFTTPEVMWTLIMKLPHTEVKFYPEVKSQTGLNSLRVSRKRALKWIAIPLTLSKIKVIFVRTLKTNICCVGWISTITLSKFIRNKQNLIDEDKCCLHQLNEEESWQYFYVSEKKSA